MSEKSALSTPAELAYGNGKGIAAPIQTAMLSVTAAQLQLLDETLDQMHVNRKMAAAFADLEQQVSALKTALAPNDAEPK